MQNSLENMEILDNIKFMIKYCDTFLDYCHNENLSIDGNIAGEIIDSITNLEEFLEKPDETLTDDEILSILEDLTDIYDGLTSLNDIKIFNNIHIVYSEILKETKEKITNKEE